MSDIHFKAWDNKNKVWLDNTFNVSSYSNVFLLEFGEEVWIDATLCRSTGYKDIRGRILFENDIIRDHMKRIYFIKYRQDYCMFMHQDLQGYQGRFEWKNELNFEYVGNMFENANLLEAKQ